MSRYRDQTLKKHFSPRAIFLELVLGLCQKVGPCWLSCLEWKGIWCLFLVYVFSRTFLSCLSPVGGWTWCPNIHLILMGVFQMLMVQSALLCTVPLCFLWFILPIPDWLSKFCLSWVFDSDVLSCGFLFINLLLVLFAVYYFYLIILFDVCCCCCCCCVLSYAFIMIDVCFKVNIKSKLSLFAFLNACSCAYHQLAPLLKLF